MKRILLQIIMRDKDLLLKVVSTAIVAPTTLVVGYVFIKRRWTRRVLSAGKCNLPTVMWLPKFLNYHPIHDEDGTCKKEQHRRGWFNNTFQRSHKKKQEKDESNHEIYCHSTKKMGSSSITNILPRMERFNGPDGMYATVYGISTKVVHIAHPTPARIVLTGENPTMLAKTKKQITKNSKKKRGVAYSLGAVKNPAYDHFDNLFGSAVFTADGDDWKSKRASVLHCLLKGCTKDESKESQRLIMEANRAADTFINSVMPMESSSSTGHIGTINIVKLLQRSTIGLIYRFLTHNEIDSNDSISVTNIHSSIREENGPTSLLQKKHIDSDDDSTTDSTASFSSQSATCNVSSHSQNSQHFTSSSKSINAPTGSTDKKRHDPIHLLSSYLEAITNIRMIILAQSRSIWFLLPRWVYKMFSPMYLEEEKEMKTIREFAQCACFNALPGSPLYSLRSRKSHNHTLESSVIDGNNVNKALLDEAITLLFAGQDTSAATFSWTLHLLSLHPNVQERLAQEISDALNDYDSNNETHCFPRSDEYDNDYLTTYRKIDKKMVIKLPYLDAVLKESMRLYPVAPFVVRNLPEELSIPHEESDKFFTIPKDTLACIWIYGLHRNKKFWYQPNHFIPERWIDPELQKLDAGQRNGSFIPFASGPRNCVGQPLAHIVLRIVLAKIIYFCEFSDDRLKNLREHCKSDEEIREATSPFRKDMQAGFTVLPTGGVHLNVNKRKID